jgi:hypothetical protein
VHATDVASYTHDTEEFHPPCLVALLVCTGELPPDVLRTNPDLAVQRYSSGQAAEDRPWPVFALEEGALSDAAPCAYRLCPEAG